MANDVLVRIIGDSTLYEAALLKAQKQIKNFNAAHDPMQNAIKGATAVIGKLAAGLGVAMGAQEAFNKTIASTQTLTDEYARVMASATNVVDSFFASLAQGDFSNFLNGLNDVIRSAREAYNDLDRLGSMDVFKGKEDAEYNKERARLRLEIRRNPANEDAKKQLEELDNSYQKRIQEEAEQATRSYFSGMRAALRKEGAKGSDDYLNKQIQETLSSFGSYEAATKRYNELQDQIKKGTTSASAGGFGNSGGGFSMQRRSAAAQSILDSQEYKMLRAIAELGDEELRKVNALQARAANSMAGVYNDQARDTRLINGGSGSARSAAKAATDSITTEEKAEIETWKALEQQIADERKKMAELYRKNVEGMSNDEIVEDEGPDTSAVEARQKAYEMAIDKIEEYNELLKFASADEKSMLENQVSLWENVAESMDPAYKKLKLMSEEQKKQKEFTATMGNIAEGMNGIAAAFGSFNNSGLQVISKAALMAEAVAIMISKLKTSKTVWDFAAGIGAGMASIVSAFSSFAEGGVVGGTSFQDGIAARVSSGEMVINEADQKRLYDSIHSGNFGGGGGVTRVNGEQLILAINNTAQRKGLGKIQFGG